MADEQPQTDGYDAKELQASYSRFYAVRPSHQIVIDTRINSAAPSIKEDFNKAAHGTDVVSDNEMSVLTWQQMHVYRGNPLEKGDVNIQPDMRALMRMIDRKQILGQWDEKDVAEETRLIKKIAADAHLDEDHVRWMARSYEATVTADGTPAFDPKGKNTPAKQELMTLLTKQALTGELSPEDAERMNKDIGDYMKQNGYSGTQAGTLMNDYANALTTAATKRQQEALKIDNDDAQERKNGYGEAYNYGGATGSKYANVLGVQGDGDVAHFRAWQVMTPDLPDHPPPFSKELGEFLVSLHESQHIMRQGQNDQIAQERGEKQGPAYKGMTNAQTVQAGEIDADRAIVQFLNQQHEPAAKEYYLQMREVDSFAQGVFSKDFSHDTATFLRVYEKTGKQLDLEAFDAEKQKLFDRINQKVSLESNDEGRGKVGDIMGAVQDLLNEDKAQKDPSKKMSALQRAEAESFLKDATAMGYHANPDYPRAVPPKPGVAVAPPAAAPPEKVPPAPGAKA